MKFYWLYIFLGVTVVSARKPGSSNNNTSKSTKNSQNQNCGVDITLSCLTPTATSPLPLSTNIDILASSTPSPSSSSANSVNISVLAGVMVPVVFIIGALLFLLIQVYPSWRKKRQGIQKPVSSGWEEYNFKSDQFNASDFHMPTMQQNVDAISSKTTLKSLPPLPHPSTMEPRWKINGDNMNEKYEINVEEKCEVEPYRRI